MAGPGSRVISEQVFDDCSTTGFYRTKGQFSMAFARDRHNSESKFIYKNTLGMFVSATRELLRDDVPDFALGDLAMISDDRVYRRL